MADIGARARAVVRVLERTQAGVSLLVLLAGALFVGRATDPTAIDALLGPLVLVLVGGGVVLAGLDLLDAPMRFWGFADSELPVTSGRILTWVLRLLEFGIAVLIGLSVVGFGSFQTDPPPLGDGVLLAGLSGVQLWSVLIGLLVVLRVGLAAVAATQE